jgi:hypothetical protein
VTPPAGLALVTALALTVGAALAHAQDGDHAATAAPTAVQEAAVDSVRYNTKITNNNLVGVTVSNYGFIGNNFVSRAPSFEYPLGSNNEHLVRAGIWIGAQAIDDQGAFNGVTTGAIDGSAGSSSQAATEYTPAGLEILERSSLTNSPNFDRHSISEEDLVGSFSDEPARHFSPENHRPLNVLVRQENYDWSFSDYAHFVIFHYVITNQGLPLRNAWVGLYGELASGTRADYSVWPPSSSSSITGGWFKKKWVQYEDSLRLFREHYCYNEPVPDGCNLAHVPEWVGFALLGARVGADTASVLPRKQVTLASWLYQPGSALRDQDTERYDIMSSGLVQDLNGPDFQPFEGDPVELLAVGPFEEIDPGDSISVDFVFVGGAEIPDIQKHTKVAQRAYDLHYQVPVPPPSPRLKVVAREQAVDIYWDDSPESAEDPTSPDPHDFEGYRVYLSEDRLDLHRVAQYDLATPPHDTTGFNTGLDVARLPAPVTFDGVTYQYRYTVTGLRDGFHYFAAVTAYDLGTSEIESLESGASQNKTMVIPGPAPAEIAGDKIAVFPNPYRVEARWDVGQKVRDHYLWFSNLPERCTLRIYTLSGDLVFETAFDGRTYAGEGARGVYDPTRELDVKAPTLSGSTYAWNLITREGQAAATGLYLYSVEDASGKRARAVGRFLIVKSDREE